MMHGHKNIKLYSNKCH